MTEACTYVGCNNQVVRFFFEALIHWISGDVENLVFNTFIYLEPLFSRTEETRRNIGIGIRVVASHVVWRSGGDSLKYSVRCTTSARAYFEDFQIGLPVGGQLEELV